VQAAPAASLQSTLAPDACTTRAHPALAAATRNIAMRTSAAFFTVSRSEKSTLKLHATHRDATGENHAMAKLRAPELKKHINEIYDQVGLEKRKL
jgi:hypothetical protein